MIPIEAFKQQLITKSNIGNFYIFLYKGDAFLPLQYSHEIATILGKDIVQIDGVECIPKHSIFSVDEKNLYLLLTDELSLKNLDSFENCIILCSKVDSSTRKLYEDFIIEFPKLEQWQIQDYVYSNCDGVDTKQLDWLMSIYGYDIYRLNNEISKLTIFDKRVRQALFNELAEEQFVDGSDKTIFDFTDAILKRDWKKLYSVYQKIEYCDVEPLGVVTILLKNFRNIINIQLGKNPTAESCGLSGKQFYVVKTYNCGIYNREQLVKIYRMLLNIDKYLKTGYLSNDKIIDYIITYISGVL